MILTLEALSRFCSVYSTRWPQFTKPWWCEETRKTWASDTCIAVSTPIRFDGVDTAVTPKALMRFAWGYAGQTIIPSRIVFSGFGPWKYEELEGAKFDHKYLTKIRQLGGVRMSLWHPPAEKHPLLHFRNNEVEGFLCSVDLDEFQESLAKSVSTDVPPTEFEVCMNQLHDAADRGGGDFRDVALSWIPRLVDMVKGAKVNDE